MSYDISIYRIETKLKEQQYKGDDFFDNTENFVPFTKEQKQYFRENLEAMDYEFHQEFHQENEYGSVFWHKEYGEALLSDKALYFSTSFNEDCIFEVGLFASELAMEDEFAKYDPQNTGWEEIE